MSWQDLIISIGQAIFILALIPSILSKNKPALASSVVTAAVLLVFALTYASLGLWMAVVACSITASCWLILAYQRYQQIKAERKKNG